MIWLDSNLCLAGRAVEELPGDPGRRPSAKYALTDALDMENMLAAQND